MNATVATIPIVTAVTAVFAAALFALLSLRVSLMRSGAGIPFGDADDGRLRARVRAHGNLAENAPLFLILLGVSEVAGGKQELIWLLAGLFAVARVVHAAGLSTGQHRNLGRRIGGMLTLWCHVGVAVLLAHSLVSWLDS